MSVTSVISEKPVIASYRFSFFDSTLKDSKMAATNSKTKRSHVWDREAKRLAGGTGMVPAKQSAESELRRTILTCLLWEDITYEGGESVVDRIGRLVPQVDPLVCSQLAIEARFTQKLRHVPLLLVREMARHDSHKHFVAKTLTTVINRPDEICEFVSLYWKTNGGKKSLAHCLKKGLGDAFLKFDEYQFAKWNRKGKDVSLHDVMRLVHPRPTQGKEQLFRDIVKDTLATPYTWETQLSASKDKTKTWTELLESKKVGALALLKNLRGIEAAGVDRKLVREALDRANPSMLLPIDFLRAADNSSFSTQIEQLMFRSLAQFPKLGGYTIFVLDVSGSMRAGLSERTQYNRMDAGIAMAILAKEMCEDCKIYLTAGSDYSRTHKTEEIPSVRGFGLRHLINGKFHQMGGGGIFTRQCLDYIRGREKTTPDRIVIFSDSQDCDVVNKTPSPFGKKNYIVDVSSHSHGVNYKGVWTAEISGWSEHFLRYIAEIERSGDQKV